MPVRVAQPERISGMADQLRHPSYSTSVGLLRLGLVMDQEDERRGRTNASVKSRNGGSYRPFESYLGAASVGAPRGPRGRGPDLRRLFSGLMHRLLPEEDE